MKTEDVIMLAVTLLILGEVSYLLAKLPRTSIKSRDRAILVDTSVLMDGRIVKIATSGFVGGTLVVPRSVVGELQLLADGSDSDKRARARYGLDVVAELQNLDGVNVELLQDGSRASEGVDERLLTLAKQHHAVILTLDFNLNKVAAVEGVKVLNINELAQGLRMSHLPGDQTVLELVQKGQDSHQAVGYLPDGTMVVVEQSSAYIGKTVHVEVIRSLQTAAGKMMFAKRIDTGKKPTAQTPVTGRSPVRGNNEHRNKTQQDRPQESTPRRTTARKPVQQQRTTPKPQLVEVVPASPRTPAPTVSPKAPTSTTPAAARPQDAPAAPHARRRNNRRPDREAALIALVNNQD